MTEHLCKADGNLHKSRFDENRHYVCIFKKEADWTECMKSIKPLELHQCCAPQSSELEICAQNLISHDNATPIAVHLRLDKNPVWSLKKPNMKGIGHYRCFGLGSCLTRPSVSLNPSTSNILGKGVDLERRTGFPPRHWAAHVKTERMLCTHWFLAGSRR